MYYSYGVEPGGVRGGHAHKALRQFLVCVNGAIEVFLDDGLGRTETLVLNTPEKGLFLGPDLWHTMRWIERDSVLLVLASDHYDESDYILRLTLRYLPTRNMATSINGAVAAKSTRQ